jgi:hypothetical protein
MGRHARLTISRSGASTIANGHIGVYEDRSMQVDHKMRFVLVASTLDQAKADQRDCIHGTSRFNFCIADKDIE